ncbi:hypothetical protein F8568_025920 [Actinomadura sp. LD22]|uniref:Uncharacterized protein n=1 Tax=Actinomadura physcomitrii TaxID=2650748 RepID=A0A6I4MJC4_9ACTN|nr:hypothetical protein [Actinomadura physcomitrii]MWA03761.1 hypothetical protein [Actinomadura physcomitrii]
MDVVDRASCLIDGFATCSALVAGVEDGAAEDVECFVETRAVVMDEALFHVLAREEAFELEEELVEAGCGCVDGVQHSVDGRRPGKAARLADGPRQRADGALRSWAYCSVSWSVMLSRPVWVRSWVMSALLEVQALCGRARADRGHGPSFLLRSGR